MGGLRNLFSSEAPDSKSCDFISAAAPVEMNVRKYVRAFFNSEAHEADELGMVKVEKMFSGLHKQKVIVSKSTNRTSEADVKASNRPLSNDSNITDQVRGGNSTDARRGISGQANFADDGLAEFEKVVSEFLHPKNGSGSGSSS